MGESCCRNRYPEWMPVSIVVISLLGFVGLATGSGIPSVAMLAWLAVFAPAGGAWMGRWARAPQAWAPALCWALYLLLFGGIPSPFQASVAILGLYAVGMGMGAWFSPERAAGVALLLACALSLAPTLGGALERPWPPTVTARLLDLSPVALAAESGGVDWMRHPAVYDAAGTADIGPELRSGKRSWLAATALLVLGCLCSLLARTRTSERSEA